MHDPFVANPPITAKLDVGTMKTLDRLGQGIDNIIMSIGEKLDRITETLRTDTGKLSIALDKNPLDVGQSTAPVAPSLSPDGPSAGRSPGRSIEAPNVPQHVQSLANSVGTKSMSCEHCDNSMSGQLTPMTITANVQTRSQGFGMGV